MPELPEVEVFRKSIEPFIINQTISSVIIKTKKLGNKNPNNIKHKILGKSVQSVERHGKYILIYLTFGNLIIHLGMSGQLRLFAQNDPLNKHDHVVIIFSSGISLRINDPRKFGSIVWVSGNPLQIKPLNNLGIDPISREFSGEYLYNKSRKRSITIKQFIMNTKVIAGVGNIYANEALFAAGIHPLRKANAISRKRYNHLAIVLNNILKKSIKLGGTMLDFRNGEEMPGKYNRLIQVYGRNQKPCPVCGSIIQRIFLGHRSAYYCRKCQK